ncbi:flagellar hook-associated protein 1 FlgK [Microvirga flocculans]|uniref:Flagellar hook-associated protein 1 n=1 Tax=Microvirga flocculans TaxID=217168 RepID=A0A7W6IFZ6_9HYPH|nr:flagellar hook-associated protein FlgK [Microvirga flocculans]MBB4040774.1 flagellar hook-associated protein 1 FlgK [Microvirga flocculans]
MSLSVAYNTARSSLQASQSQMAVVSRNTSGASDPSYSRKIAALTTGGGYARVTVFRASDQALLTKMLETTSDAATQKALLEGLKKLSETIGDPELDQSPAARIGALSSALQQYANTPDNAARARAFVKAASDLAESLNQATATIQAIRLEADTGMAHSVARINDLLQKFEAANNQVMSGSALGADVTDAMDTRDSLIAQLSEEIGITVVPRAGNDIALYTDSGVPLFDRLPRKVEFTPKTVYDPTVTGGSVSIDGIQVTGAGATMPLNSGNLVGLARLRDDVAGTYQFQLDELARSVIAAFAESDQSGAAQPDMPGVFTFPGATGVPAPPAFAGLAGLIKVNDTVDPDKGGSFDFIRDGGINGADYVYNPDGNANAAFSQRLNGLSDAMVAQRGIDASLGFGPTASLHSLAALSGSWVEATRQSASQSVDYQNTLLAHASEALSNATDVNMDDETALMLQLEKSYAASAKLLSVIDQMLKTLLSVVG